MNNFDTLKMYEITIGTEKSIPKDAFSYSTSIT